jgi:hypothetical protein
VASRRLDKALGWSYSCGVLLPRVQSGFRLLPDTAEGAGGVLGRRFPAVQRAFPGTGGLDGPGVVRPDGRQRGRARHRRALAKETKLIGLLLSRPDHLTAALFLPVRPYGPSGPGTLAGVAPTGVSVPLAVVGQSRNVFCFQRLGRRGLCHAPGFEGASEERGLPGRTACPPDGPFGWDGKASDRRGAWPCAPTPRGHTPLRATPAQTPTRGCVRERVQATMC